MPGTGSSAPHPLLVLLIAAQLVVVTVAPPTARALAAEAAGLGTTITATWNGVGVRAWADQIGGLVGLPVMVDPRIDPDSPIRLDCAGETAADALNRAAASLHAEIAILRSSVVIVPAGHADRRERADAALAAEVASLPRSQRKIIESKSTWRWPAGARPADLLRDAAAEAGVILTGVDGVPHDHLPAMSPATLSLAERLDLVAAAYDLRVIWRPAATAIGRAPTGRIVPLDMDLPRSGDRPTTTARGTGGSRGTQARSDTPKAAVQTFSLQVAAPLDELLATLAKKLGLSLQLDRESLAKHGIAPGEIVRRSVKDASREALLDAILDPLGLDWSIEDGVLLVR